MKRRRKEALIAAILLLLLLLLLIFVGRRKWIARPVAAPAAPPTPIAAPPTAPAPVIPKPAVRHMAPITPQIPVPRPVPVKPSATVPVVPSSPTVPVPTPPPPIAPAQEGLHKELIPKNITIERIYYEQDVTAPGTQFGFDINGSGFDPAFQQMITVDFDALDVEPRDLRLVTANQIHGIVNVGDAATTQYIRPKILIRGLPVFRASEPFGVVRPGEVLDIQLLKIDETGQMGEFQVTTNLTRDQMKHFRIEPTTPRLELSSITPRLPFYVAGILKISPGLSSGEYGLTTFMGNHVLLKKDPLVDVVHPDVGRTGTVESVKAEEPAHRPGDEVGLKVSGSGFSAGDAANMTAKVQTFDMGPGQFTYVSPGELRLTFRVPPNAPNGLYGVALYSKGKLVYQRKTAFAIVPPNWLDRVKLSQPIRPGQRGLAQLVGRELAPSFVQSLKIETDDPGLAVSPPRLQDPSTAVFDVTVSTAVAPGDYIMHVSFNNQPLKLPGGNIIQVTP